VIILEIKKDIAFGSFSLAKKRKRQDVVCVSPINFSMQDLCARF